MFGDLLAMNGKLTVWAGYIVLLLVVIALCVSIPLRRPVLRAYDNWCLAKFARRVADTDRIVATTVDSKSVSVTLTGNDAKRVVGAVSTGGSVRTPPGAEPPARYGTRATFYQGTNALGDIQLCGFLFLIPHSRPPFRDYTDALVSLDLAVNKALREEWAGGRTD